MLDSLLESFSAGYGRAFARQYAGQYARQFTRVDSAGQYGRDAVGLRQYTVTLCKTVHLDQAYTDGQYARRIDQDLSYTVGYARATPGPNYSDGQYATNKLPGPSYASQLCKSRHQDRVTQTGSMRRLVSRPTIILLTTQGSTPGPAYSDGQYTRS